MVNVNFLYGSSIKAKLLRFALVGGTSTLAYGVFTWLAVERWHLGPTAASICSYLFVVPINFLLQRSFTFRSNNEMLVEIPRFLLVHGLNLLISTLVMAIVTETLRFDYRWGIALVMTIVPALVFVAMDKWVFHKYTP